MSNSRTQTIRYKPRFTQMEAYDRLPRPIRDALKEGPQEWDTNAVLRRYEKLCKSVSPFRAQREVVAEINSWHREEIRKGHPWRPRKPGQRWRDVPLSPHVQARAKMAISGPYLMEYKI